MRRLLPPGVFLTCIAVGLAEPGLAAAQATGGTAHPAPANATAATTAAASASPGPDTHPESAGSVQEAQLHTQRALQHFRAHEYTEAIHEFELANRAAPSADYWYNIARSHELLSHYDEAVDYYRRYLRDKVDPPDRADVERRITELQRLAEQARAAARRQSTQATIRFEMGNSPNGASVYLGDRSLGHTPLQGPVDVPPGTYPLRVDAPGFQEWRGQVRVRRGETGIAFVSLQPATQYETRSGHHVVSYILGGLTLAAFGVGGYFGVMSRTDSIDACAMTGMCARHDDAVRADILFGVGAGLLLTTAIVYFVEAASSHTERVHNAASGAPRASR